MKRLALSLGGASAGLLAAAVGVAVTIGTSAFDEFSIIAVLGTYGAVGALLAVRRPDNPLGWVFSAACLLGAVGLVTSEWAQAAVGRDGLPLGIAAAWVAHWFWLPLLGLMLVGPFLLFPDGRVPGPRWRPVGWFTTVWLVCGTVAAMLDPTLDVAGTDATLDNPVSGAWAGWLEAGGPAETVFVAGLFAILVLAAASVIVRFRRSAGVARRQIKWMALAAAVAVAHLVAGATVVDALIADERLAGPAGDVLFAVVVSLIPIAMGLAVLRYRLYEIDRIISRTVAYAVVAGVLAAAYAGTVTALTALLPSQNALAVAAATLAAAALFNPVRRRIQAAVDLRFNRARYDAQRVVDEFAASLRARVDPADVVAGWVATVRQALQPATVGVWTRQAP